MILKKYIKNKSEEKFFPYEDIKLTEKEVNIIRKFPEDIMEKLFLITEMELSRKVIKEDISLENAKWAIQFAKYLKNYFKN